MSVQVDVRCRYPAMTEIISLSPDMTLDQLLTETFKALKPQIPELWYEKYGAKNWTKMDSAEVVWANMNGVFQSTKLTDSNIDAVLKRMQNRSIDDDFIQVELPRDEAAISAALLEAEEAKREEERKSPLKIGGFEVGSKSFWKKQAKDVFKML